MARNDTVVNLFTGGLALLKPVYWLRIPFNWMEDFDKLMDERDALFQSRWDADPIPPRLISLRSLASHLTTAPATPFEQNRVPALVINQNDLYVAGDTITIDGVIEGDLVATGGTINVGGAVEGDLIAAGQSVTVNGTVNDDVRPAGAALQLGPEAQLSDDLLAGGYSLQTATGSSMAPRASFTYCPRYGSTAAGSRSARPAAMSVNLCSVMFL